MLKQVFCFLAVLLLLTAVGNAEVKVFENGSFLNCWQEGGDFSIVNAPDATVSAHTEKTGTWAWASISNSGSTNIGANIYLEFDAYFDTTAQSGTRINTFHMQVNGDNGWTYKWEGNSTVWVNGNQDNLWDGVPFPENEWAHFKLDLTTNTQGGEFPANPNMGAIRMQFPEATSLYLDNITFTGAPENASPDVDAGVNQQIVLPTNTVQLDGTVSDDGMPDPPGAVTTLWEQISGPGTVSFGDDSAVDTSATFSTAGTYELRLTADDSELTGSDSVIITVYEEGYNNAPSADAGSDQIITLPDDYVDLNGTVSDDGIPDPPGTLTTLWETVSGPAAVNIDNPSAVDTFATFTTAGTYELRLTADDGDLSTSDEITVTVNPEGLVALYGKFEKSFQVDTVADNLQMPYDATPPAGVTPEQGVTVDVQFTPDDWQTVYTQPAFYYKDYDHQTVSGKDWIYPTGNDCWKVRFTPTEPGTWKYKIITTDAGGTTESEVMSFPVSDQPANKGFVKNSGEDTRYFEFSNGDFFLGLGYNMTYGMCDWKEPVTGNESNFEFLNQQGAQLFRTWLTHWSIYTSAWSAWTSPKSSLHSLYIPDAGMSIDQAYPGHDVSMKLVYDYRPVMWIGHFKKVPAVKPYTTYKIKITYNLPSDLDGPRVGGNPYGLVAKTSGWNQSLYNSGQGTVRSNYANQATTGWEVLEGEFTTGNDYWIPQGFFSLCLENVNEGSVAYIDKVEIREDLGNGELGPDIMTKPKMNQHQYMDQRLSFAFDKVMELAEEYDIYFKLVLLEKNDWTLDHINHDGQMVSSGSNEYFYGDWRNMTKNRWLQQAWWRYCQARWGYSTKIHSWELLNEGDPWNSRHYTQADEFGAYMHQFGNDHLVTTSFWHSFPKDNFWANSNYPNIDYADIHKYETGCIDTAASTYDLSLYRGAERPEGADMPLIRGETGFGSEVTSDTDAIWMHNYIWGLINSGGMYEQYWCEHNEFGQSPDPREHFLPFKHFMEGIPLNNGNFVDAGATAGSGLRAWGQVDTSAGKTHLWIQNKSHTWKNIVDGNPIPAVTGTVELPNVVANKKYAVQWWDPYESNKSQQVISTEIVYADGSGTLTLDVTDLQTDIAVKVIDIEGDLNNDMTVNYKDLAVLAGDWLLTPGSGDADIAPADGGDGVVDWRDFALVVKNWLTDY